MDVRRGAFPLSTGLIGPPSDYLSDLELLLFDGEMFARKGHPSRRRAHVPRHERGFHEACLFRPSAPWRHLHRF